MLRLLPRPMSYHRQISSYCSQPPVKAGAAGVQWVVPSESALQTLAAALALKLVGGDVYLLYGQVGAGKTTFSRAFIRAVMAAPDYPVTSPTFTLQNIYDEHEGPEIHHFDLYRLQGPQARMDLAHSFATAVSLVEWPERLPAEAVPRPHLAVHLKRMDVAEQLQAASGQSSLQGLPEAEALDEYEDRAWRLVTLHGSSQDWERRCQDITQILDGMDEALAKPCLLT